MHPLMQRALVLAQRGLTLTSPNPRVGCVIATADGTLLGEGHTQRAGQAHAEVMALRDAAARGNVVTGATAYVTLEPCAHHGRTGPCCEALIAAGVKKVIASLADPNPLVAGQGFARLRAAGIEVEEGPGATQSRELNIGFFSRMVRRRPWVRLKVAASLDGRTALYNGNSRWITSDAARTDGHAWRARACTILTGIGTVLHDHPRLDVRLTETPRQPAVAIVDSTLQTPLDAPLFVADRACCIYAAVQNDARKAALEERGASVIYLPDGHGRVDLRALLTDLAHRQTNELHVEAGARLNGALIQAHLVDEYLVYLAPTIVGPGLGMAQFGPLTDLAQAHRLEFTSFELVGADLRVLARTPGADRF